MQLNSTLLRACIVMTCASLIHDFSFSPACGAPVPWQADQAVEEFVEPADLSAETIVARVDNETITAGEVRHFLSERFKHLPESQRNAAMRQPEIMASGLQQLIERKIVFLKMVDDGTAYSDESIEVEVSRFERELQVGGETLNQWLQKQGISRRQFEFEMQWRLSWKRLLERSLTDEILQAHYDNNRRQFDGSELMVAHILIKDTSEDSVAKLNAVREQLLAGSLIWSEAVAEHSQAPSRENDGRIGWININGPMDPAFTGSAFKLQSGEVSEVTRSPFGIHLIKCVEVKPGKNEFRDVIEEVRNTVTEYGFRQIVSAAYEKGTRTIQFDGNWPYFNRDGTIVTPDDAQQNNAESAEQDDRG